jgi:hypothetical protein
MAFLFLLSGFFILGASLVESYKYSNMFSSYELPFGFSQLRAEEENQKSPSMFPLKSFFLYFFKPNSQYNYSYDY